MTTLVHRTRRSTDRVLTQFVFIAWIAFMAAIMFWPASFWYELRSVEVTDQFGSDRTRILIVDRTIYRQSPGDWQVEEHIREDGGWREVRRCRGSAIYRPDKALPDPVTLGWWQGNDCEWVGRDHRILPGDWRVCTAVEILPGYLPKRRTPQICSNTFPRRPDDPAVLATSTP